MDSTPDANKEMIRHFVEDVKNKREFDKIGDIFQADYTERNDTVRSFGGGVEGYKRFLNHLFTAFPEDVVTIDQIVAEGDRVAYWGTESGTHRAEFLGIPATGKSATWTEIQFFRIENGKVAEHWVQVDIYAWFQQLGVIPANG